MISAMFVNKDNTDLIANRKRGMMADVWRRLRKNKLAMVGLALIVLLVLAAILAPVLTPYAYDKQDLSNTLQYPSAEHLLGTDNFGRDILSRLLYGGRISLLVSLTAVLISFVGGGILGAVAGYFGGKVDTIIMRLMDVIMAIPGMLMATCVSITLGGGPIQTAIAISITGIAGACRMIRATALSVRSQEFIEAAKSSGSGNMRIILTHLIPNCLAPLIVEISLRLGANIMMVSSLSFIGLGVQPPTPEWGAILNAGREYLRDFYPMVLFPALAIMLTMFGFNVLGDGVRDAMDPKLRN